MIYTIPSLITFVVFAVVLFRLWSIVYDQKSVIEQLNRENETLIHRNEVLTKANESLSSEVEPLKTLLHAMHAQLVAQAKKP